MLIIPFLFALLSIDWWTLFPDIILSLVSYALGVLTGWKFTGDDAAITKPMLRKMIALVVTLMWSISIIADILVAGYTTHIALYAIMGGVAGYLFSEEGFTINIGNH